MAQIDEILNFWFTEPDGTAGKNRKVWFTKDPEFDAIVRDRFLADDQAAATGALDSWQESATGCLALILLLDQFPRNMFRGQPESFATDEKALAVAQGAIAQVSLRHQAHGSDSALRTVAPSQCNSRSREYVRGNRILEATGILFLKSFGFWIGDFGF